MWYSGKKQVKKGKVAQEPKAQTDGAYPVSLAWGMSRSIATPPLDGMLIHRSVTPQQYVAGTHIIHLGEERQSGVKFLVWGNNAMGEAYTQGLQIWSSRCWPLGHTHLHQQAVDL